MSQYDFWRQKYLVKHAAQKVIGAAPGLYRLQERFKQLTGRWQQPASPQWIEQHARDTVDHLVQAQIAPPNYVVEQGTGWHGLDAVIFYLSGSERIDTYDVRPWLREQLVRGVCRCVELIAPIVASWPGVDVTLLDERVRRAREAARLPLRELLESMNIRYCVTSTMQRGDVPSGSADLFYSNSVLQRFEAGELTDLLAESRRFLAPHGSSFHRIDCKDFHSITDPRIPELYYLSFSDATWRLLTSKYLNGQNRLRLPHFLQMFDAAGFAAETPWHVLTQENLSYVRASLADHVELGEMDAEAAAISRFDILASPREAACITGERRARCA